LCAPEPLNGFPSPRRITAVTEPAPTKTRSAAPTTSAAARRASEFSCTSPASFRIVHAASGAARDLRYGEMRATAGRLGHLAGCGWFWAWALVGVGFGFGISVIGIFTVPLSLLAVFFLTRRQPVRGGWGIATGIGLFLLLIAYIQRSGEFYNPVHWLIPGLVLFFGGMVGHVLTRPD
jgi:hypothetical protein